MTIDYWLLTKQFSCFVQELYGMNLFQEADVMAQVGEERVLGEFRTLDFAACLKRPKPIERF